MALTKATLIDLNSNELILDLDADTSITADTDDTIHLKIAGSDEITITGTALSPAASDGNALGTAALEWADLFLADGAVISLGDDQDVTLTHVADTGVLLNSTNKIQFNDSTQFIHGSSATVLSLGATSEIDLTATAIDINGTCDVSGAFTTTTITASGIVKTDDTTEATSTTDGSLQTDGGLSVAKDAVFGDDVKLLSDAAVLGFGADGDVTLTHVADTGVLLNSTMAIQFNDASQYINAPSNAILDINATDEIELNATLVDINANVEISGTASVGGVLTTSAAISGSTAEFSGAVTIQGAVIINEDSADVDTRIESNGNTHMLFVDGGSDHVNIGTSSDLGAMLNVGGDVTSSGNITGAQILATSSCKPSAANGAPLGSADLEWADLYLYDGAQILWGADQDVTLTHVADTGLLLNSTMAIQFNDASQYINAPSNAILDINATDEIELNATLVDVNANLDVSGTITSGGVVTGTAFTAGSAVLAEAELELLDGLTAGTAIASKVVTTDGSIDTTGQRNLTISGELDAATLDISGAVDIAGASVLHGLLTQDGGAVFNEASADVDFRVESNATANRFFIDGGSNSGLGAVIIGHNASLNQHRVLQLTGTTSDTAGFELAKYSADSSGPTIIFNKSRSGTIGTSTVVADNDTVGTISWMPNDGTDSGNYMAEIKAIIDGTPGTNDTPGELVFSTAPDGSNGVTDRMKIRASGDVEVSTGDIVFSTAGKGICLGVTSNTDSNTLDDYEEGTYEPTIVGSSSGNYVCSTNKTLSYTKVGRMVNISGKLMPDTDNSANGTLQFSLPFTGVTDSETEAETAGNCFMRSGGTEIPNNISTLIGAGASTFYITYSEDTGDSNNVTHAQVDAAFDIWFGFWYMAA